MYVQNRNRKGRKKKEIGEILKRYDFAYAEYDTVKAALPITKTAPALIETTGNKTD